MRWALSLQPYQYRLEVKKGSQNVGADYMSRISAGFYIGCLKSAVLAYVYIDLGRNKLWDIGTQITVYSVGLTYVYDKKKMKTWKFDLGL